MKLNACVCAGNENVFQFEFPVNEKIEFFSQEIYASQIFENETLKMLVTKT